MNALLVMILLTSASITQADCKQEVKKLEECKKLKGECKPYENWIKKFCPKR